MMKDGKYITSLSSEEALDFIMQSDQFHNFELPEYFDFTTVLQHVRSKVGELSYDECIAVDAVSDIDGISSRKCSWQKSIEKCRVNYYIWETRAYMDASNELVKANEIKTI